jgi:hypothetical protein
MIILALSYKPPEHYSSGKVAIRLFDHYLYPRPSLICWVMSSMALLYAPKKGICPIFTLI